VFEAYGIPTVEHRVTRDEDTAVAAAEALGYPVVVKVLSPGIVHKTDVGGLRVDLQDADEVRTAVREMGEAIRNAGLEADVRGWLVERFLVGGKETIVGMSTDPAFGPVLMFGLGGIYVEALADVAFRLQPVSAEDAHDMIGSLRGRRLLEGVRGEPPVDKDALRDVIQRVSQLVGDHPEIAELDINPLLAFPDGVRAVDARIRLVSSRRAAPHPVAPVG
jgi:acetate---CoA ligase (ADP-forming)